jgi:phosphoribosyl 1,2-cyclic phosphodiesterase
MAVRLTVLGSGSAGNATCIEGGGARILLDAGFSCRELTARLRCVGIDPRDLDALLITHEHADHIRGASLFSKTYRVPVYCTDDTARAAHLERQGVHARVTVTTGTAFSIGEVRISPFLVPHDAVETVGYVVEAEEARVGYATDLGHAPSEVRDGLRDCDLLMLESNHDEAMLRSGPYPEVVKQRVLSRHGHLSNETAAELLCEVVSDRTQRVILAHLSRTNNRPGLALASALATFERDGRRAPHLHAADQAAPSIWFEV